MLRTCTRRYIAATTGITLAGAAAVGVPRPGARPVMVDTGVPGQPPQRIYKSLYPSILEELGKHHSLCDYMFNQWAAADQTKPALIQAETKQQLTYPQLRQLTHKVACILYHSYDIRKGDVVAVSLLDNILYPAITYGIMELGAVVTTANAITSPEILSTQMKASNAKVLVASRKFHQVAEGTVEFIQKHDSREVRILFLEDIMQMQVDKLPASYTAMQEAKPEDVIFLPFSSGTTGTSKGTRLTNKCITANLLQSIPFGATENETLLSVLPFFHIFGFTCIMSATLSSLSTQVVMMSFNAHAYLEALQQYKINGVFVAPPMVAALLHRLEAPEWKGDLSSLRFCVSSSSPLSPDVCRRVQKILPNVIIGQGWGMTEMSPAVTAQPRDIPPTNISYEVCGSLISDTEFRVVKVDDNQQSGADKSAGIDVEEGEEGEIWVRGPQMMKGYIKEEDTKVAIQDGWYRTGDIGRVVKDRESLVITDRLKELIKYKGFQVSPATMEKALLSHSWVRDCIVIGIPDPRDVSFEMPRALVMLKDNISTKDAVRASDELFRFIMKKMPPHQRLHGGVRIVESIPRNATNKLMRRQARQAEIDYVNSLDRETDAV